MSTVTETLNQLDEAQFVTLFGALYEHSPWIACKAFSQRPFTSPDAVLEAMKTVMAQADEADQHALVRAHPELARRVGVDPTLTSASQAEQASAGLDRLTPAEYAQFNSLNTAYRDRFAMPFVICVRLSDKELILSEMARRVQNTPEVELRTALEQIDRIAALRFADVLKKLETHA